MIDKALSLNLTRIEELHKAGADGVINVMCHNCMLGTITASLSGSMRRDMADLPIATFVYEGLQSTHNTNRIEAFIHQVHNYQNSVKTGQEKRQMKKKRIGVVSRRRPRLAPGCLRFGRGGEAAGSG